MDVDAVEESRPSDIAFSSDQKGKKMSKANLPVSAGDTLPWYSHRPFHSYPPS